jgi:hypothetical protein
MRRELLLLLVMVLAVDAGFIAGYFLFRLDAAGDSTKIGFVTAWTIVTLLVVLRGLARIRSRRGRGGA